MSRLKSNAFIISMMSRQGCSAAAMPTRILIKLDDGFEKAEVMLDSPDKGLIVESNMWRDMLWQQDNSVLCVAADSYYEEDDYIRDYEKFLHHVGAK